MWNMLYSQMLYPCGAQRALVFFFLLLFLSIPPRKAAERKRGSVRLKMDHLLSVCEALMKLVLTFYITHITFCSFALPYSSPSCSVTLVRLKWWQNLAYLFIYLLPNCRSNTKPHNQNKTKRNKQTKTNLYTFPCHHILGLSPCCMEITQRTKTIFIQGPFSERMLI